MRTKRLFTLAFALPLLLASSSASASLMTVTTPEPIEINWVATESAPANPPSQKAPIDQDPCLWSLANGLAGSMESGTTSVNIHVSNGHFNSVHYFVHDGKGKEVCLIDFQFVPDAIPDARDKPPKHVII